MSQAPQDPRSNDPANTQMFRAFVARGEEETQSRKWVLPVTLAVVLAVVLVVVLLIVL